MVLRSYLFVGIKLPSQTLTACEISEFERTEFTRPMASLGWRGSLVSRPSFFQRNAFSTNNWSRKQLCTAKSYPNDSSLFTNAFKFANTDTILPTYRIMDESGTILNPKEDPKVHLVVTTAKEFSWGVK